MSNAVGGPEMRSAENAVKTATSCLKSLSARIAHVEATLGLRLLRRHEMAMSAQACTVIGSVDEGLCVSEVRRCARFPWDLHSNGVALADLVLQTLDGRFLAILLPPDVAMNLRFGRRFLQWDASRRMQMLDEDYTATTCEALMQDSAKRARRTMIEQRTDITLIEGFELAVMLAEASFLVRYVSTVDPGGLDLRDAKAWSVKQNGRLMADVVVRLPDGRSGAFLVDPDEAESMRRLRHVPALMRIDAFRIPNVL